jgi:hypothetical protein
MAIYSVFAPPGRQRGSIDYAQRFVFVRDGFSWSAFIFGPLWMLRHGLILAPIAWVVLVALIVIVARFWSVPSGSETTVIVLLALLTGFEGSTLRRLSLQQRGWRDLGIVVGEDIEIAERRFFDAWVHGEGALTEAELLPRRRMPGDPPGPDVIGLFPEPGRRP